jgi:16S rRNA (cytidine1402-2'-O)-methyltransferase
VLYVVATPIGNLDDVSPRVARVLGEVDTVAAEDTRTARKLLSHLGVKANLVSLHEHSSDARVHELLALLDASDVALVSEAGTPCVSDPGTRLVSLAHERGHAVSAVPGPSAVTAALSVSGLPADTFLFLGFLPRRSSDRRQLLTDVARERRTLVAFEAPHRVVESLADIADILGHERTLAVARELTKLFEQVWRGTVGEALAIWESAAPRGEFTLVVEGASDETPQPWDEERIRDELIALRAEGAGAREASRLVSEKAGLPAREIYRLWEHDK